MRLHSNVLVSAYRIGLRVGEADGAQTADDSAARAEGEPGVGDRKSFGDIGDLTGATPEATVDPIPNYAAPSFDAEPESGIARTVDAADETPSGIVLVADVVAPELFEPIDAVEALPPADDIEVTDLVDVLVTRPASGPAPSMALDLSDSQGGLNASRASLDGLTVLERYDGSSDVTGEGISFGADPFAPMAADEAASGVVDVVPAASVELEIALDLAPAPEADAEAATDVASTSAAPSAAPAPPASVVPVAPAASVAPADLAPYEKVADDDERPSTPIARVSISRMAAVVLESAPPSGTRRVQIALTVSPSLLGGCDEAFVTLTLADGKVVHEGTCNAEGYLTVSVVIPGTEDELRALLDTGSKYKNARIKLADTGITEYLFR